MTLKKYLIITILFIFSIVKSSVAEIPANSFRGILNKISNYFHYLNPLWGKIALDSGIIDNLRFYGDFTPDEKNETRSYIKDQSDDETWNVIKILFPSPSGNLATESSSNTSFGRYVVNTKPIAHLLNYSRTIRNNSDDDIVEEIKKLNNILGIPKKHKNKVLQPLLESIKNSIKKEGKFYPRFFTESIILSFFVHKFNSQQDIWNLLKDINEVFNLKIASNIPDFEEPVTLDYLDTLVKKEKLNVENIYNLKKIDTFFKIVPYDDEKLIQDVSICAYMIDEGEEEGRIEPKAIFSDCAETALRHVLNLLFYDYENNSFVIPKGPEGSKHYRNLINFYNEQQPSMANNSSKPIRQAWNKVVSNLDGIRYNRTFKNEIDPGFINFIKVIKKIFSLEVEPPEDKSKWSEWVEEVLPQVFAHLNPNFSFEPNFDLNVKEKDVYGTVNITVGKKDKKEDLFSFTINQEDNPPHAYIDNLKIIKELPKEQKEKQLTYQNAIKNKVNLDKLMPYQMGLALILGEEPKNEPFLTFKKSLNTNEARIEWVKNLLSEKLVAEKSVGNVLNDILWEDPNAQKEVGPILLELLKQGKYVEAIKFNIGRLRANDIFINIGDNKISLKEFKKLKYLRLENNKTIKALAEDDLPSSIKEVTFSNNPNISTILLKNLPDLEYIWLSNSNIETLNLENLPKLSYINLSRSNIRHISLVNLSNLKNLNLSYIKNLIDLSFINQLNKGVIIDVSGADFSEAFYLQDNKKAPVTQDWLKSVGAKGVPIL